MLTRIALYTTLGVLMDALGFAVTGLGFWCVLGLFIACDRLSRIEGEQFGTADGVRRYLAMSDEQQAEIRKMIKQWEGK